MDTLGVDLSSDPQATAVCMLKWSAGQLAIELLEPSAPGQRVTDQRLVELINQADRSGIDSPFGWPKPFVAAVSGWESGAGWPSPDRVRLRYRRTDEQLRGKPKMPLSVSTDRLGATAMRCANLLSQLERVDRAGLEGPVVEIYPASGLHVWGLPSKGYKRDDAQAFEKRKKIVAGLEQGLGWQPTPEERPRLVAEHDLLDAFVASLIVRAVELDKASQPKSNEEMKLATTEGWIRIPKCPLSELIT